MSKFDFSTAIRYLKDHPVAIVTVAVCWLIVQIPLALIAQALMLELTQVVFLAIFAIFVVFSVYVIYINNKE